MKGQIKELSVLSLIKITQTFPYNFQDFTITVTICQITRPARLKRYFFVNGAKQLPYRILLTMKGRKLIIILMHFTKKGKDL